MKFKGSKAQSAIEYLMTYGWMLLVVAIVGGAIFSTVQGQCTDSVSGFAGSDVLVDDFGSTSTDKIQFELRNTGAEEADIKRIAFKQNNKTVEIGSVRSIDVSDTAVYSTDGLVESSSCNTIDVTVNYDTGGLDDLQTTGTITTSGEILDLTSESANLPQEDLQMRFDAMTIGKTDGSEISKWIDLTNGANNATAINDSRLPEVNADGVNGYQALRFEPGPKDILTMPHKDYLTSRNHTIFSVAQFNDVSSTVAVTSKYEPGSRLNTIHIRDNKTFLNWNDNSGWKERTGSTNISNRPRLMSTRVGSNVTAFLDGNQEYTEQVDNPLTLNNGPVSFGAVKCPSCGDYWELDGNIGEIIYYNRTLSDSEMDEVHNYLSEKWDLN